MSSFLTCDAKQIQHCAGCGQNLQADESFKLFLVEVDRTHDGSSILHSIEITDTNTTTSNTSESTSSSSSSDNNIEKETELENGLSVVVKAAHEVCYPIVLRDVGISLRQLKFRRVYQQAENTLYCDPFLKQTSTYRPTYDLGVKIIADRLTYGVKEVKNHLAIGSRITNRVDTSLLGHTETFVHESLDVLEGMGFISKPGLHMNHFYDMFSWVHGYQIVELILTINGDKNSLTFNKDSLFNAIRHHFAKHPKLFDNQYHILVDPSDIEQICDKTNTTSKVCHCYVALVVSHPSPFSSSTSVDTSVNVKTLLEPSQISEARRKLTTALWNLSSSISDFCLNMGDWSISGSHTREGGTTPTFESDIKITTEMNRPHQLTIYHNVNVYKGLQIVWMHQNLLTTILPEERYLSNRKTDMCVMLVKDAESQIIMDIGNNANAFQDIINYVKQSAKATIYLPL